MSNDNNNLFDIVLPNYSTEKLIFKGKYGQTYLFKYDEPAFLIRVPHTFGSKYSDLEIKRRIEATEYAKSNLIDLVPDTNFIIGNARLNEGGFIHDIPIIARILPWFTNISSVKDFRLKEVLNDSSLCRDIARITYFVLKAFITTGKFFDLFVTFDQVRNSKSISFLKLLSNNIMRGFDSDKNKMVTFIDPDWYFELKDKTITGFPSSSYLKRIIEGFITLSILCVITFILSLRSKK